LKCTERYVTTYLWWHFKAVETDATSIVDVWVIDRRDKLNTWRLKWIPTAVTVVNIMTDQSN